MHLEISFWNQCNNNCVMCTNPSSFRRERPISFEKIEKYLNWVIKEKAALEKNVEDIYLTGGEPTMQPDFFRIIRYLRRRFPVARINILSNGRRFSYRDFVQFCTELGRVSFIIPIHGHTEKIHDNVAQAKGSFKQTIKGLRNIFSLRKPEQTLEIRIIVTKFTFKNLRQTLNFLFKNFPEIDRIVVIFLEYEGRAIENLKTVSLKYSEFNSEFRRLKPYLKKETEIRFYHFPLCVVPEAFWSHLWRTLRDDEIIYLDKCRVCTVQKLCLGIPKNYMQLFGKQEFKPVISIEDLAIKETNNYYHPIENVKRKKN